MSDDLFNWKGRVSVPDVPDVSPGLSRLSSADQLAEARRVFAPEPKPIRPPADRTPPPTAPTRTRDHTTEQMTRTQRDVQILAGRRGDRDLHAVRWGDIDTMIGELAQRFQNTSGELITAFGGLPSSEISRRITTTINYVDAEAAAAIAEAEAAIDTAKAELTTLFETDVAEARAEADALFASLNTRFDQEIPRITTAEQQIDDFALALSFLASRIQQTDQRVADAGVYVDPADGSVKIVGFEQVENRVALAEVRVDAAEAEIVSRVTYAEMNQAISEAVLDPEQIPILDDFELRLNTVEEDIDAVNASITEKASTTVVDGIDVRLQSAETEIDALEAEIVLKAAASDLTAVDARLTGAEVVIDALDVPAITQTVYDSRLAFDELDEANINSLQDLLDAYKDREAVREDLAFARQEIAAVINDEREATAAARLELVALIDANSAAITVEQAARTDADSAIAASLTEIQADVDANSASISQEQIARTNADDALAADITTLTADVGDNAAAITAEAAARANADTAITGQINTLSATVGQNTADISSEELARVNADDALAADITALAADVGDNAAAITAESVARANADSALSGQITTLTADVEGNTSAITAETVARTNADSALATDISTLQTDFNGIESSVTTQGNAISTLESFAAATYTIRAVAGSAEALLEVVAADDPVNGPVSAFRFDADAILFDGSVQAKHLDADSVTADKISTTSLSAISAVIGELKSAETGARFVLKTDALEVYDASDVLRVKIGNLT
ncbi:MULTISPECIES: hypothetical protein [unclassified Mameliella]|uniref:hypothetical protein n=1 Tax=Mameliella sp. LZ-28 TaxID=2484146 RepID=UPI00143F770A|nr:hypothetical protein [Mameliella sp. LZ-28]MCR9276253.1 hypothetical protein [Paracoccaceae bacterium]